jgi:hypothetical protein
VLISFFLFVSFFFIFIFFKREKKKKQLSTNSVYFSFLCSFHSASSFACLLLQKNIKSRNNLHVKRFFFFYTKMEKFSSHFQYFLWFSLKFTFNENFFFFPIIRFSRKIMSFFVWFSNWIWWGSLWGGV